MNEVGMVDATGDELVLCIRWNWNLWRKTSSLRLGHDLSKCVRRCSDAAFWMRNTCVQLRVRRNMAKIRSQIKGSEIITLLCL